MNLNGANQTPQAKMTAQSLRYRSGQSQSNSRDLGNMTKNKDWILRELQQATVDLTITSKPDLLDTIGEGLVDDLALDFNNYLATAKPYLNSTDNSGLNLLTVIDEKLKRISGEDNCELWTIDAFINDDVWKEIRRDAAIAIKHFGWSDSHAN